jgi:hypothetical protein
VSDFEIRGADDIDALVKRIRNHADAKALRREMFRALNASTRQMRGEIHEAIPAALPTSGGLSASVQGSTRFNTSAKGGKHAGVTLWARNRKHDIRTLTGKRLRHPVYGNRDRWVNQTAGVEPAVILGVFDKQKPHVREQILKVMNDIAKKVAD